MLDEQKSQTSQFTHLSQGHEDTLPNPIHGVGRGEMRGADLLTDKGSGDRRQHSRTAVQPAAAPKLTCCHLSSGLPIPPLRSSGRENPLNSLKSWVTPWDGQRRNCED